MKKPNQPQKDNQIGWFLIPEQYRKQSIYKEHPLFRGTLLVIILGLLAASANGYQWWLATKLQKAKNATREILLADTNRLQAQSAALATTKSRYREMDILQKQLRIPLSPILDSVEKTIPDALSITRLDFSCIPIATSPVNKRKGTVKMLVFFPEGSSPTDDTLTNWTTPLFEALLQRGLKGKDPNWGSQREIPGQSSTNKGWIRELSYAVELDPTKK